MKKIKFMLLSLALLAVVGGALAFKAKYIETFCTTNARALPVGYTCKDAQNIPLKCPTKIINRTTKLPVNNFHCTTTPFLNAQGELTCTKDGVTLNCLPQVVETIID